MKADIAEDEGYGLQYDWAS